MVLSIINEIISLPWLLFNTIVCLIVYQCIIRYWDYFSKNNVKYLRGIPFLGTTIGGIIGLEPMTTSFQRIYNAHEDEPVLGLYGFFGLPQYFIHDPELIKQIGISDFDHFTNHLVEMGEQSDPMFSRSLFFMRDQRWRDMRATLSPAFTGSKMKLMFGFMVEVCDAYVGYLKKELKAGPKVYDVGDLTERFANDIIATCAFGNNVNSLEDKENIFFKSGEPLSKFTGLKGLKFIGYFVIPKILNFFKVKVLEEKEVDYFRTIVKDNFKYREDNNIVRNDVINLLIQAKKGTLSHAGNDERDADAGFATVSESSLGSDANKIKKWTDDDLLAQSMIFFLAGFGTVSKTLSFAIHEVTVNPEVQQKIYNEAKETIENLNGKPLTYDVLQKMKYVDMVMSETLRKWPQIPTLDRSVNKPYTIHTRLGQTIRVNVGDSILIPVTPIHYNPKYYPNPEKFYPERFSDENKHTILPGTYMPFGIGPRSCIGSRFALMECKAILVYLVSNFHLEMCEKTQHPLILKSGPTPPDAQKGFWIQLRNRV